MAFRKRYRSARRSRNRRRRRYTARPRRAPRYNTGPTFRQTFPVEYRWTFNVEAKNEWCKELRRANPTDILQNEQFKQLLCIYEQFKFNSLYVNIQPATLLDSPERLKCWTVQHKCYNRDDWRAEELKLAEEQKGGYGMSPSNYFKNNPKAKQSMHCAGQRSSHRHWLKATAATEKTTWHLCRAFTTVERPVVIPATGAVGVTAMGSAIADSLDPHGFLPAIKCGIQRMLRTDTAKTIYVIVTMKFNVSFRGFGFRETEITEQQGNTQEDDIM